MYKRESFESYPVWGEYFIDASRHCANLSNRDKKWYFVAYNNLANYYEKLKKNYGNEKRKVLFINLIGHVFNCMCNKINGNPTKTDIQNMHRVLTNPTSELRSRSGLSNDNINYMYYIYRVWIASVTKYYEKKATYSESDIAETHCNKTNKNFKWYEDGYTLIVKIYYRIHNNLVSKSIGYATLGYLFNCLINKTTFDPVNSHSYLQNIFNTLNNPHSSFWLNNNLGNYRTYLRMIFNEWMNIYAKKTQLGSEKKLESKKETAINVSTGTSKKSNNRDVKYFDDQRISYCNTINRDKQWYLDTYKIIERLDKFTEELLTNDNTTESRRGKSVISMFLNCMINNSNSNPYEEKAANLNKIKRTLSVTSSNKKADGTMSHSASLKEFLKRSQLEFDPHIIKLQKIFVNTKVDS